MPREKRNLQVSVLMERYEPDELTIGCEVYYTLNSAKGEGRFDGYGPFKVKTKWVGDRRKMMLVNPQGIAIEATGKFCSKVTFWSPAT